MAERVALITSINNEMMNESFELFLAGVSKEEAKERLENLISQIYSAKENIKKTRIVVQNMWYDTAKPLHNEAVDAAKYLSQTERLPIHWALLLTQYKIFSDLCETLGHFYEIRDVVKASQIKEEMGEKWGARNSVLFAVTRTFKSLCDMGVLEKVSSLAYTKKRITVSDPKVVALLFAAVMIAIDRQYLTWETFITHPAIFPFAICNVTQADMAAIPYLTMELMGGQVVFRIKQNIECVVSRSQ